MSFFAKTGYLESSQFLSFWGYDKTTLEHSLLTRQEISWMNKHLLFWIGLPALVGVRGMKKARTARRQMSVLSQSRHQPLRRFSDAHLVYKQKGSKDWRGVITTHYTGISSFQYFKSWTRINLGKNYFVIMVYNYHFEFWEITSPCMSPCRSMFRFRTWLGYGPMRFCSFWMTVQKHTNATDNDKMLIYMNIFSLFQCLNASWIWRTLKKKNNQINTP